MTRTLALLPGTGLGRSYSSSTIDAWEAGQVREVSDAEAMYLLSTFPECFVEHHDPAAIDRQPVISVPTAAKKASNPRARGKG